MLVDSNEEQISSGTPSALATNRLNKKVVKEMVSAYRRANKGGFKYAHFNALEVLKLFISNKVIDPTKPIDAQLTNITKFGLKIYLGTHTSENTLAHIKDPVKRAKHLGKTTTILCNTEITEDETYGALFKDILNDVAVASDNSSGNGLDQAETAPPYHDDAPEDDNHDAGYPL